MTMSVLAILAARSFLWSSCSITTEFCAGGMHPCMRIVKATTAYVIALVVSISKNRTADKIRSVQKANTGDSKKRDAMMAMIVRADRRGDTKSSSVVSVGVVVVSPPFDDEEEKDRRLPARTSMTAGR